jgi:hypothetical protein
MRVTDGLNKTQHTQKGAFQVKREHTKNLRKRKKKIEKRLDPLSNTQDRGPVFSTKRIDYEFSQRINAVSAGGIGVIHEMVSKLGLQDEIDRNLNLLKIHRPYHESDHVLNIAYNILCGGCRLEDIENNRTDEGLLNAFGATRIPDPTTAGDFTRRFDSDSIETLMDCFNRVREKVWRICPELLSGEVVLDIDGTIAPVEGECKEGMNLSYKGIWGYAPLIVSVSNTKEVLYLKNRPGNVPSHQDAAEWIDRACALVRNHADQIVLRGDTDFSQTQHLDRWDDQGVRFVFGMDARANLVNIAEDLPESAWKRLSRRPKYEVQTRPRKRPENVKDRIVREKGFRTFRLTGEEVAEFEYQPVACKKSYRMVVVRKNISVEEGESVLFDDIRYFFYITNVVDRTAEETVLFANQRCDQENVIEQLKNGVHAMRMPTSDLLSNWAYMVIAALAWNLKAWMAFYAPEGSSRSDIIKMEFRRFLRSFMMIPAQIIRTGRRIIFRYLAYTDHLEIIFRTYDRLRCT